MDNCDFCLLQPHLLGDTPPELVRRWSEESYSHYRKMYFSKDAGVAGIQQIKVHNLFSDEDNDGQVGYYSDITILKLS